MTKTQHTPGPWVASSMEMDAADWAALNEGEIEIVRRGQDVIAAVWCGDDRNGEERANARLFASAPELLEALEAYVTMHPAFRARAIGAQNSQARAEQDAAIAWEDKARAAIAKARG